jgi:hypothetical protein
MSPQGGADESRSWLAHVPAGAVSAFEILVLGLLAAYLVLVVIPGAFEIESSCVGRLGVQSTDGDSYIGGLVAVGTLGWLGVFLGTIWASIADKPRMVVLLPALWFAAFVLGALVLAIWVGPQPCPA